MGFTLKAIVAMDPDRLIGKGVQLPWHLPEDLKWFKKATMGHAVLMGRKTYDSILESLGKPLPGRLNVVLSRSPKPAEFTADSQKAELLWINKLEELGASARVAQEEVLFVIGGAEIYSHLLPHCEDLLITHVKKEYEGDVYFPDYTEQFELAEELFETEEFTVCSYKNRDLADAAV